MRVELAIGTDQTRLGGGLASVSLAFAFGQLWWGLTQPLAGNVSDKFGPGRVLIVGVLLVAGGTMLIPYMQSTAGLIFAIGVLSAGGAGMAGPSVLMAATTRLVAPTQRAMATSIVNSGGSFGQFVLAPVAQAVVSAAGWVAAVQTLGVLTLLALPAAWVLRAPARLAPAAGAAVGKPRPRVPQSAAPWPTPASSCWRWASRSAASTSPSWLRTCPA